MKITNETKVGILAAVAIAILILGYSFLKGNDVFSREQELYAAYDNVEGLAVSNPVLVNGFQIGRVSNLRLLENGRIMAQLKINPDYEIPRNTVARLESTSLLGSKAIVFELGNSSKYAVSGDTLNSNIQKDLLQQVKPVQQKAEAMITRLDSILTSLNNTISPEFQQNFNSSFASIAHILQTLESTTRKVDGMVGTQGNRLTAIFANLESISGNFKNNNQRISAIMGNLETVTDKFARANFDQTIRNADKAVADMQAAVNKVNAGQGSLGKLINDDGLYNNLNNAAENLDKLMLDLKAHPGRYVSFSVFGGKKD
ncbi:phospholipid/cholesterol/gamma-HCH transport system substrate-binding protein [Arcticibacter tournemirensis]|uniref:MCE family protein n=1 Tax=Arcticibacter tournemirensis TaxID=699437 RepID=A0A4V1KIE4_9SPHI|nr:MlaD family protein [Arcticibacter tournemirensis]KAA8485021.1 MCE family protein [Arcticibacter tournemirensis]RXF70402.1 MCE family protein [Arcticibacter tournemirensis]TQM50524.1 phospholipid/cholesterol/gamma-HCH transport system substrate-binding protein [Arcticibacter tournemirensis]